MDQLMIRFYGLRSWKSSFVHPLNFKLSQQPVLSWNKVKEGEFDVGGYVLSCLWWQPVAAAFLSEFWSYGYIFCVNYWARLSDWVHPSPDVLRMTLFVSTQQSRFRKSSCFCCSALKELCPMYNNNVRDSPGKVPLRYLFPPDRW